MADERKVQTPGRKANAARPLTESDDAQGSKHAAKPADATTGPRGALAQKSGTSSGGDAG
ncbi:MAG: hypothetical protein ABW360_07020 [Phenylobacterium sp.]